MDYTQSPLVIGATQGSGTRMVAAICQKVGYFMGSRYSDSYDSQDFLPFYDTWIEVSLSNTIGTLPKEQTTQMLTDFQDCVKKHRENLSPTTGLWGWKNYRSIFLVPFFHALYPDMKFIHVVRDGRDIAFYAEQSQFLQYARLFFGEKWNTLPLPHISILMWDATNVTIANYGEKKMGKNYLRIRFEDICEHPHAILKTLRHFLDGETFDIQSLIKEISQPNDIGAWHHYPLDFIDKLKSLGNKGLTKFGYIH